MISSDVTCSSTSPLKLLLGSLGSLWGKHNMSDDLFPIDIEL